MFLVKAGVVGQFNLAPHFWSVVRNVLTALNQRLKGRFGDNHAKYLSCGHGSADRAR
jgi:hypothetical protein